MSCNFGSVRPSVRPFATQDRRIGLSVFSDFLHEVKKKCNKKSDKARFLKQISVGSGEPKKSQKCGVLGFDKNLVYLFYLNMKVLMVLQKPHVREKPSSWVIVQKPQDQSECRIL